MSRSQITVVIAVLVVLVTASFSIFTVDEREKAVLFRLGEIIRTDFDPGLHFKVPFVNNVRKFDSRVLNLDSEPERFLTSEKKNVIVDSFVKWRIEDVERYYTTMGGSQQRASLRLSQIIKDGLRNEFGKRTIQEVVSGERGQITEILFVDANKQVQDFGISVVDVRMKRVDLPTEVSASVYQRMEAERERVAKELRAQGSEAAERIRADADRRRTVLLAEAFREAEQTRGEGDARATAIYANAYGKNTEFFSFYRSLNAYTKSFGAPSDIIVHQPNSDFYRYFKDVRGLGAAATEQAASSAAGANIASDGGAK